MKISLVVATFLRKGELSRLLASLAEQTFPAFEVIVVDQNPVGFLDDTIAPYKDRLTIIHKIVTPLGVSASRNVGLGLVRDADIVAFPDDDCWYEPDTLKKMVEFFQTHPEQDCVIGTWDKCHIKPVTRFSVFYKAPTWLYALRKCWADRIGGFDESIGPGPNSEYIGGEDTAYLLSGMLAGMKVMREPSIKIHHPDMPKDSRAAEKVRAYGVARMALLNKYHYPLWFRLLNLLYPLSMIFLHPAQHAYWLNMFKGRYDVFMFKPTVD